MTAQSGHISVSKSELPFFMLRGAQFNLLFLFFFLMWVCFSGRLCCSWAAPYISKHKAAAAGKIGPLRLCSNVNVWSFIWSSDVILMMEELLLWTAGLVRSKWVPRTRLLSRLSGSFHHSCDHVKSRSWSFLNICSSLLKRSWSVGWSSHPQPRAGAFYGFGLM